jgi:hypothetical protein
MNKNFELIFKRLKPLVRANNIAGINLLFEDFSSELVLSKEFINFCRNRKDSNLVIFLCTLYIQNIDEDLEIKKILLCYQYIQSSSLSSINFVNINNKFLTSFCNLIISNSQLCEFEIIESSSFDYLLAVELALDFNKPNLAQYLLNYHVDMFKRKRFYLRLAIYLCNIKFPTTNENNVDFLRIIKIYENVLTNIKSENNSKLNSKLSLALIKICLISKNYETMFKYYNFITGDEDAAVMNFQFAIANTFLNRMPETIKNLDKLLSIFLKQNDIFIQKKFSSLGSTSNFEKKPLDPQGVSISLSDLQKVLNSENIKIFLVSGTLLGYARENSILSHDKDVDVGMFFHNKIDKCIELIKLSNLFHLKVNHHGSGNIYNISLIHKSTNISIDIFVYHFENHQLITGVQHSFGYLQKFSFTPFDLILVNFLDNLIHIPNNYELNLEENFGNWKTPDKHYISHLESPSTFEKGGVVYMIVLRLELMKSIIENNQIKIKKIISLSNSYSEKKYNISISIVNRIKKRWLSNLIVT